MESGKRETNLMASEGEERADWREVGMGWLRERSLNAMI